MNETNFKVLMHLGAYVDANLLEKGIYTCTKPYLYNMDETIETLISKADKIQRTIGINQISDRYFDNLKQCQLVPVIIYAVI